MSPVVAAEDPAGADALALVAELSATLAAITGATGQASFDVADVLVPRACFAIARDAAGRALGCGALRPLEGDIAEVKRMYARPGTRAVAFYRRHGYRPIAGYGRYAGSEQSICFEKRIAG